MILLLTLIAVAYVGMAVYLAQGMVRFRGTFEWWKFRKMLALTIWWLPFGLWLVVDALWHSYWMHRFKQKQIDNDDTKV